MSIRYMGTKRKLLPEIDETISLCKDGPLLDLFSGMCAVGSEIAPKRQIWTNDAQIFASSFAKARFTSKEVPADLTKFIGYIEKYFMLNMEKLENLYSPLLKKENKVLASSNVESLNKVSNQILNNDICTKDKRNISHHLFSQNYAGGYFSLRQSTEIDSIRFAIDKTYKRDLISEEQHRWFLIALAQAMSNASNTTGHFAQYLKIKKSNLNFSIKQKQKSIWSEWCNAYGTLNVIGDVKWRKKNKVFNECSLKLMSRMPKWKK